MRAYEDTQAYAAELRQHIHTDGLNSDIVAQLSDAIVLADTGNQQKSSPADGLNLKIGKRILRDRDLPILESIGMVAAAITAVVAPAALAAPAVISGLASFAKLVWSTWRNSAKLAESEIAVLGLLQVHGPLSQDDLIKKAAETFPDMSADTVAHTLVSLTDVEQLDGDIVELIRKDASGRWRTHGDV